MKGELVEPVEVTEMLSASVPLIRKYGTIAAKRVFRLFPHLLRDAKSSTDPDISLFSADALERYGIKDEIDKMRKQAEDAVKKKPKPSKP